eukprot:CAMPEP_0184987118 /NCGR_PEP_ID=MMETSP1098-20130426/19164_1 /TAXON_ID=89044 /ORGANISM="Spumella elongata, Strain CCAP 955/1" /LENGTH=112 /DNA_ID=CAMNT_0027511555 /DNA_START=109 /DNA_END=444 /DNA_ORIENTATION=-
MKLQLSLVLLTLISSLFSRVAAAESEDGLLRDASARNTEAHGMGQLTREEARVDLALAADTTPAHSIIIIITALDRASSALIVEKDASKFLLLFVFCAAQANHCISITVRRL